MFSFTTVFVFLHVFYPYHFFYIEQFQLFIFTPHFFIEHLSNPGGFVEYLSLFAIQFFIVPYVGPATISFFITLSFLFSFLMVNKLQNDNGLKNRFWLLSVGTALSCLYLTVDFNFYLHGVFAYLLCLLFILLILQVENPFLRLTLSFVAVPLIFWVAGSVSVLFATVLSIYEVYQNRLWNRKLGWGLLLVWAVVISYFAVRYGYIGSTRAAFLPDMYAQPRVIPSVFVYIPWGFCVGIVLIIPQLKKIKFPGTRVIQHGIQIVILLSVLVYWLVSLGQRKFYMFQKFDYYARNEQWDKIIEAQLGKKQSNYLLLNYLNLAYAQKGQLLQHLFDANQQSVHCLKIQPDNIRILAPLLCDIDFCIGDFASSQQYAFEGNLICRGAGSGRLLKRLAEAALMFGNDQLARKYCQLLGKSWFYNKWAERHLIELNSLVLSNSPDLIAKRKCLPAKNSREFASDFPVQLEQLSWFNPENYAASNYLQAYYLLSKDIERLCSFLGSNPELNLGKKEVPEACQQALLAYFEAKPDLWAAKGITIKTVELYQSYKSFLRNDQNDKELRTLMKKYFGNTYWFYLQFN